MIEKLIRNSDLSALLKLVNPSFFKVVPVGQLLAIGTKILANKRIFSIDHPGIRLSLSQFSQVGFHVSNLDPQNDASAKGQDESLVADQILELYFFQILACDTWLLDFRSKCFKAVEGKGWVWYPGAYFLSPTFSFVKYVRQLYLGFYFENPSEFESGLKGLGILSSKQILRNHFGQDQQSNVKFKLAEFEQTFAKVFDSCAKNRERIMPEFAALGILLLTLYENLESTEQSYDVRSAFLRAHKKWVELK